MSTYNRELSNLSYTNKDFGQIYPELLDLAKKISYKWDPSLSDESDPGVVLLKLAALMADKCNYNIDKNVLELFPLSVTQLSNARQLFEQCGYTMHHYHSATTSLTFRMISEPEITDSDVSALVPAPASLTANDIKTNPEYIRHYIVPKFTMFSDVDNSVIYTITEEVEILSDGSSCSVEAIQGAVTDYTVNGSTVVTADMLDANNRIYFTETHIPENGIFISNVDSVTSERWKQTDNLLLEEIGTRCYKFGLTLDGNRCYIEFPTDIDTLIGKGLNIKYVLTSGLDGNIRRQFIREFFSDTKVYRKLGALTLQQEVELTSDNVYVINEDASQDGKNPETIEEAYRNYQRVKTTFKTLVSTKDYSNFLVTNKDLSNCVVCDRSDDLQSSYNILDVVDGVPQQVAHVRTKSVPKTVEFKDSTGVYREGTYDVTEDEMTAFDLRVYGLKYVDGFYDYKSFSRSFDVVGSKQYIFSTQDVKCLAHNYLQFEPDRIILLKNRYPIVAKIVSPHKLTPSQQEEILNRIKLDLFQLLNSQVIKFGQEIDYNLVYDTILKADPRISAIILEEFRYETYAVYLSSSSKTIETMRIDADSSAPESSNAARKAELEQLWTKFRTDVYARCVLSGNTPLFVSDSTFVYSLAHEQAQDGNITYAVEQMSTAVDIPLTYDVFSNTLTSRLLKENDVITLTSPNLIGTTTYSNYCQFVTNIGCRDRDGKNIRPDYDDSDYGIAVTSGSDYMLLSHEYIIFFWRNTDDESEPYNYVKYTGRTRSSEEMPTIISPSFNMKRQPNTANMGGVQFDIDDDYFLTLGDTAFTYSDGKQMTVPLGEMYSSGSIKLNDLVSRFFIGEHFNVKSRSIEPKKINKIHLNNTDNGTNKFYWILNSSKDGNYRLFSESPEDTEYTLKEGEQLIYSNAKATQLYILGAGTKIQRTGPVSSGYWRSWDCPVLEHTAEFLTEGPHYFEEESHPWFNMRDVPEFQLYATEMQYRKLGSNTQLTIQLPEGKLSEEKEYYITADGIKSRKKSHPSDPLTRDAELQDWMCSYKIVNELSSEEELASRNHVSLKWEISSSLNLNMSQEEPQRLYSHQRISWLPEGTTDDTLWLSVQGSDSEEIRIQSDRVVKRLGSTRIDVRYYDVLSEEYIPLQIYLYKMKDIDLSDTAEGNNFNIPWTFSTSEIVTSGYDRELSNVSLPEGDYILPISITNVNHHVDVFWTELRKLQDSKLTSVECSMMQTLQPQTATPDGSDDWYSARKPVELSDVAMWVYGSAYVDVSTEFKDHTVTSVFEELFVRSDPTDPTSKYVRRYTNSIPDSAIPQMLVGYGGTQLSVAGGTSEPFVGDIVCIQFEETSELDVPQKWQEIWVYNPPTEGDNTKEYLRIVSGGTKTPACYRATQEEYTAALSTRTFLQDKIEFTVSPVYYYILRPSEVAPVTNNKLDVKFNACRTVTGVEVEKSGTYYFLIHSNGTNDSGTNSTYTLRIHVDLTRPTSDSVNTESAPAYKIYPPRKYTKATLSDSTTEPIPFFEDVLRMLKEMDKQALYDFTYDIPEEDLVMYPLASTSFLNPDHPMNRFTICEYTIKESSGFSKHADLVVAGRSR